MTRDGEDLKHSVAFRVSEDEWKKLLLQADKEGTSVPQLAKMLLFEKVGLNYKSRRRPYGQQ